MNQELATLKEQIAAVTAEQVELLARCSAHEQSRSATEAGALAEAEDELDAASAKLSQALVAQVMGEQPTNIASLRTQVDKLSKKVSAAREARDTQQREHQMTATTLQSLATAIAARLAVMNDRYRELIVPEIRGSCQEIMDAYAVSATETAKRYCEVLGLIAVLTNVTGKDPGLWGVDSRSIRLPGFAGQPSQLLTSADISTYQVGLHATLASLTDGLQGRLVPHHLQPHDTPHGISQKHRAEIIMPG